MEETWVWGLALPAVGSVPVGSLFNSRFQFLHLWLRSLVPTSWLVLMIGWGHAVKPLVLFLVQNKQAPVIVTFHNCCEEDCVIDPTWGGMDLMRMVTTNKERKEQMEDLSKKKLARIFWPMGLSKKQMLPVTHFGWENSTNRKSENWIYEEKWHDIWHLEFIITFMNIQEKST